MILFCLGCLVSRNLAVQSVNYPFFFSSAFSYNKRQPLSSPRSSPNYLARRLLTDDNPRAQEALRAEMLYDGSGASRIDLERLI